MIGSPSGGVRLRKRPLSADCADTEIASRASRVDAAVARKFFIVSMDVLSIYSFQLIQ